MVKLICEICKKEFWVKPYRIKEKACYCSYKCYWFSKKGKKLSKEHRKNIGISIKGKAGKYIRTPETIEKMRLSHLGVKLSMEHRMKIGRKGIESSRWDGGKHKDKAGYIMVYSPTHPFKNASGYMREHRLVWEQHNGRYLLPTEIVHHINGIIDDNRIENLMLFKNVNAHMKFHDNFSQRKLRKG